MSKGGAKSGATATGTVLTREELEAERAEHAQHDDAMPEGAVTSAVADVAQPTPASAAPTEFPLTADAWAAGLNRTGVSRLLRAGFIGFLRASGRPRDEMKYRAEWQIEFDEFVKRPTQ